MAAVARPASGSAESITSPTQRVVAGQLQEGPSYRKIRPYGTTDWLLLVTVSGLGRVRLGDRPAIAAGPRRIIVIEPHTMQDYGTDPAVGQWSLRWAHAVVPPDWEPLLDWPLVAPGVRQIVVDDQVRARVVDDLDRAIVAQRRGLRRSEQFAMNALEAALLWCDTQNPRRPVLDSRLLAVLDHIGDHLDRPHTVESLAQVAGLSATRLAHLATAQLGTSLIAHVEGQRMELARQLLQMTDLPVAEIGRRVGFTDPLYFSRRFRKATTLSPTTFRSRTRP